MIESNVFLITRLVFIALSLGLLLYLPGWLVLRQFGAKGSLQTVGAPALTAMLLATNAALMHLLSVPWTPPTVILSLLFSVLICFWISHKTKTTQALSLTAYAPDVFDSKWMKALTALAAFFLLLPPVWEGTLRQIPQHSDSIFHLNGVWSILTYENASPYSGLAPLYGAGVKHIYYAAVWHEWISLVSNVNNIVVVTNVALWILPLVWLHQIVVLTAMIWPNNPHPKHWAPLIVVASPLVPTALTTIISRWPNALAVTILPGIIAWMLFTFRYYYHRKQANSFGTASLVIAGLAMWLGAILTHLSSLVSIVFLFFPIGVETLLRVIRAWKRGTLTAINKLVFTSFVLVLTIWTLLVGKMSWKFMLTQVGKNLTWDHPLLKLLGILRLYNRNDGAFWQSIILNFVPALIVVGIYITVKNKRLHWSALCFIWFFFLTFASVVRIPFFTLLTAWWFSSSLRMLSVLSVLGLPLAAAGGAAISQYLRKLWQPKLTGSLATLRAQRILALGLVGLCAFGATPLRLFMNNNLYHPLNAYSLRQYSPGEYQLGQRMKNYVKPGEKVLGEAGNGSAMLPTVANVDVMLKQQNYSSLDHDGYFLRKHFNKYSEEPSVCHLIRKHNIRYYYEDPQKWFGDHNLEERSPGLFNVFTGPGFELMDQAGKVRIWRITYCDNHFLDYPLPPRKP
ncbi:hypothetical protein BK816_03335 [Boudabousia tangfeifanii]|uniref:Glycosyltransferase RgtA/B/C/D-like domain-containing protein n=1 Tax=Boudabousia tangfeifanii TaxID=1912795 RepID=A0A1D9MJT4_9ACTO|nr:DUF6541 family protein [Boudabousia tangfeifanii]AOZ72443.1 hypothetical protein BK816_03335 [Boudabousia tangfeifanii]